MLEVTTVFGILLLTLWIIWRKRKFSILKELGIPGPEPNILFGNLWELSSKGILECHTAWVAKYGRVLGYYFGPEPVILVTDTELLKKIQVSEFQKFINRPPIFLAGRNRPARKEGFANSLTILRDKRWKEIRSIITPAFTTSKMKLMTPMISNAVDLLIQKIGEKAKIQETFDIYSMYQALTLDVIGRTAFGVQSDVQQNSNHPFFKTVRVFFSGSISNFLTLIIFSFPELGRFWGYVRRLRMILLNRGKNPTLEILSAVGRVIKMRRNDKSANRHDLLQSMIDAEISQTELASITDRDLTAADDVRQEYLKTKGDGSQKKQSSNLVRRMTDTEIIDNSAIFFLAGSETSSTALAFTTHFLIHYPEVQERIRKEVNDLILREGSLSYTSVQKMQYLDQVVCESLRLYPPAYLFVNREAKEDVTFGNICIKKGFMVQVPIYTLHRDPQLWRDPENFNPERFSPENKHCHHPMAWQPFGAGPRNCVGMRFALIEVKLALAKILLNYRLHSAYETKKEPMALRVATGFMCPAKGMYVKAVPC